MSDINKHPVLRKLYEVALSLERLPPSPEQTTTAILLSDAASDVNSLVDEVRRTAHVGVMANFTFMAAEELRAAIEPFRCDTFGCETPESQRLDKACASLDRVHTKGLLRAAQEYRAFLDLPSKPTEAETIEKCALVAEEYADGDCDGEEDARRAVYTVERKIRALATPTRKEND